MYQSKWPSLKTLQITNDGEDIEQKETSYIAGGNVNWCCQLWGKLWRFPRKLKIELPYDPAILLLGTYPQKMKTLIKKATCAPVFIAALFKTAKQPKCSSTDERIKLRHILRMKYYPQP